MRISLKFIAVLWVILLLVISGLLYNAYSKFKPETFVALLTEQVQKNYPDAKLTVGKIAYRFSLDFNLKLQEVHLRRSDKILGSIGEVELKVPWWLLLINRGNAQINISKVDIYVDHDEVPATKETLTKPDSKLIKVAIPSYLADAKFTLRAKSVSIRDIQTARRYFTVSKLLVREFQYGKNSAFELNIPIEINHNQTKYLSNLWLFGDVTPEASDWKLNFRGEFRTRENNDKFQIEDLVIHGSSIFIPRTLGITSEINLFKERDPIGHGQFVANQDHLAINLEFSKLPLNYFEFVYEVIENPYLVDLVGHASGEVKFQKKFDSLTSEFSGKLDFPGDLTLSDKNKVLGKWLVNFQNNRWELSFMAPKGEASFFRRSLLDIKSNKVIQFHEELGFNGIDLNLAIGAIKALPEFITEETSSHYKTNISFKDCLQGDKLVNGFFLYGSSPEHDFYQSELNEDKSSFKLNFSHKNNNKALDVNFSDFQWYASYGFISPYFRSDSAKLNGKLEGRWSENWDAGKWLVNIKGESLVANEGRIPDFINKTISYFSLSDKQFSSVDLKLSIKKNILNLNQLLLHNTELAKIKGTLSSKQKSILTLSYPKNKKLKPLKKEVIEPYWIQKEDI